MNIVFLTSPTTHHYYLINEIHKKFPVRKVFFQQIHRQTRPWTDKFHTLLDLQKLKLSLRKKWAALFFSKEWKQEELYEQQLLFSGQKPALNSQIPFENIMSFNQPDTVEKVRNETPDIAVVFGTQILKGQILNCAQKAILNIHRGIVPQYKGGGLPTWTLYNKDFDYVGVTIHLCTADLDAGDIVGQETYKIQKDDRFYTLRAKTTVLAARLLERVIRDFAQGKVQYIKQNSGGKTWKLKDLTLAKELTARRNLNRYLQTLTQ